MMLPWPSVNGVHERRLIFKSSIASFDVVAFWAPSSDGKLELQNRGAGVPDSDLHSADNTNSDTGGSAMGESDS